MTGQLDVRPFVPDDSTRIEAIRRDALRSAGATYGDALDPVDPDDLLGDYIDSDGAFLVGTLDGSVVATAAFRPAGEFERAVFDEDQTAAQGFYERHGFELVTRTDETIGDASFEALHYRRALSG